MATIAENLQELQDTLTDIKTSLTNKGVQNVSDALVDVPDEIDSISGGSATHQSKSVTITTNTTTTVTPDSGYDYLDSVEVTTNVPQSATLGTKSITANGTYDASNDSLDGYSQVTVNVPAVTPTHQSKSITITTNGTQTVSPDAGYDYLDNVEITTNVQQSQEMVDIYIDLYSSTVQGRQFRSDTLTIQIWDGTRSAYTAVFEAPSTYQSWWDEDGHHKFTVPKNSIVMVANNSISSNLKYRDANQSYWSTYNNTITNSAVNKTETITYHDGATTYGVFFRSFYIANVNERVVPFVFN